VVASSAEGAGPEAVEVKIASTEAVGLAWWLIGIWKKLFERIRWSRGEGHTVGAGVVRDGPVSPSRQSIKLSLS